MFGVPPTRPFARLFGALALAASCTAVAIAKDTPAPVVVRYSLPKTTIVLGLQVERSTQSPGKYCDFLDLFFPELELEAVCQPKDHNNPGDPLYAAKMKTSVTGYSVALKGTADPDRTYDVNFDASWHVERTDSLTLTEGGALTGAEMQRADRMAEIVLGTISNVAKIAGRLFFGAVIPQTLGPAGGTQPAPGPPPPWLQDARLKENFSLLSAPRQKTYADLWKTTSGLSRITLAVRSYKTVEQDLKSLDSVLSGGAGPSAQALIAELQKSVAARLGGDFLGTKTKDSWAPSYEITPKKPTPGQKTLEERLFGFAGCGIVDQHLLPVSNALSALKCGDAHSKTYELKLTLVTESGMPAVRLNKPDPDKVPNDTVLRHIRPESVDLNVDGSCSATMTLGPGKDKDDDPAPGGESDSVCGFAEQPALLAQWGDLMNIPKAGKDWAYTVSYYEATGALKSIKLSSKALLDKASVDTVFGAVNTLLDAKDTADAAAKKKADDAAGKADELNKLTRQREILDEKSKIKKLCDELGLSTCEP